MEGGTRQAQRVARRADQSAVGRKADMAFIKTPRRRQRQAQQRSHFF
jgi:hypothetical protein